MVSRSPPSPASGERREKSGTPDAGAAAAAIVVSTRSDAGAGGGCCVAELWRWAAMRPTRQRATRTPERRVAHGIEHSGQVSVGSERGG